MRRIATLEDIARGLDALCVIDPRLEKVRGMARDVPLRLSAPGTANPGTDRRHLRAVRGRSYGRGER